MKTCLICCTIGTALLSGVAWYTASHPIYTVLGLVDPKHSELMALGFLGCTLVCLVGIGVIHQLERLVDYAASTWRLTVDDPAHAPEGERT